MRFPLAKLTHPLLLATTILSHVTVAQITCPTTTAGVQSFVISACKKLQSEVSGGGSAAITITLPPRPLGSSTASTVVLVTSSSSSKSTPTRTASRAAVTTTNSAGRTITTRAASRATTPSSQSTTSAAAAAAAAGAGSSTSNNDDYTDHVVVPAAVVCSVVGAILIGLLIWFLLRRRRRQKDQEWAEKGHEESSGFAGTAAGLEKESHSNEHSNGGDESPVLPPVFQLGGNTTGTPPPKSPLRTPTAKSPQARTPQAITPRATTPPTGTPPNETVLDTSSSPMIATDAAIASSGVVAATDGTFSSSGESQRYSGQYIDQPWLIQPLRHFRRHSYGEDQSTSGDERTIPSTFESSSDQGTGSTWTYPSGLESAGTAGLVPLQEETETESRTETSVYETPTQEQDFSWLDVPDDPNRPQSSSWLSSDSNGTGGDFSQHIIDPTIPPALPAIQSQYIEPYVTAEPSSAEAHASEYQGAIQSEGWPLSSAPGDYIDTDEEVEQTSRPATATTPGPFTQRVAALLEDPGPGYASSTYESEGEAQQETLRAAPEPPKPIWIPKTPGRSSNPTSPANATPR